MLLEVRDATKWGVNDRGVISAVATEGFYQVYVCVCRQQQQQIHSPTAPEEDSYPAVVSTSYTDLESSRVASTPLHLYWVSHMHAGVTDRLYRHASMS